jgi:thiamine biosynthesis lipoprotein
MNRRDLFQVRTAAQATGQVLGLLQDPPSPVSEPEYALLRFGRRAMATLFEVLLPWGTPGADAAAHDALDRIDRLEQQLTVYRDSSEVSRLNRLAAQAPVPVEPGLFDLLALAARISAETGGAFDVTAGPLIKAWGFFRRQGRVPADDELTAVLQNVGMRHVALDADRQAVRYHRRGVEINLGSIGKGYALDQVGRLLRDKWGIRSGLLNGGTSSILALGTPPGDARGWSVGVRHPWQTERRLAVVRLRDRAMATSGATYQHFEHNHKKLGHLLDPRTGRPAEGMSLAVAFAPTAAEADALATAFYVLGVEPARRYCEEHPAVAAVLLPDGPDTDLEVINLPPDDIAPVAEPIAAFSPWDDA